MERVPHKGVDKQLAMQSIEAMQLADDRLVRQLETMGILIRTVPDDGCPARLADLKLPLHQHSATHTLLTDCGVLLASTTAYSKAFKDIVYVFTVTDELGRVTRSCTCASCLRYHTREHQVFVESFALPNAAPTRDFSHLPRNKPRGRPRGSRVARGLKDATV